MKTFFPSLKITVENKADSKFPIVSAASICAKVIFFKILEMFHFFLLQWLIYKIYYINYNKVNRDYLIQNWKFIENKEFLGEKGSGYPNDPKTKEWIKNHCDKVFGFPGLVRFSWSTCENYLLENGYTVNWLILKYK